MTKGHRKQFFQVYKVFSCCEELCSLCGFAPPAPIPTDTRNWSLGRAGARSVAQQAMGSGHLTAESGPKEMVAASPGWPWCSEGLRDVPV